MGVESNSDKSAKKSRKEGNVGRKVGAYTEFSLRELNQHTGPVIDALRKSGQAAVLSRHNRVGWEMRPISEEEDSRIRAKQKREHLRGLGYAVEEDGVEQDYREISEKELNQQTSQVVAQMRAEGKPVFITRHGVLKTVMFPLSDEDAEKMRQQQMQERLGRVFKKPDTKR